MFMSKYSISHNIKTPDQTQQETPKGQSFMMHSDVVICSPEVNGPMILFIHSLTVLSVEQFSVR